MRKRVKELALTVKKLERRQKDTYEYKNVGIQKQAEFLQQVGDWMEDGLRVKLEAELGTVPDDLQKVITTGESLVIERLHLLKIADKWGWSAVTEFTTTDLARTEAEEKKLKKIAKASEAKLEKQKEHKKYTTRSNHYQQVGTRTESDTGIRYCSTKAGATGFTIPSSGDQEREELKTGRKRKGVATSATGQDTLPRTVRCRAPGEEDDGVGDVAILYGNKCSKDIDRLDFLEGVDCEETDYSEELKGNPVEEVEQGVKVVDSLRNKSEVWVKFGAGKMVQQIVSTGLRLNFSGKVPAKYKEKNNKSFEANIQFGIDEVKKLLSLKRWTRTWLCASTPCP